MKQMNMNIIFFVIAAIVLIYWIRGVTTERINTPEILRSLFGKLMILGIGIIFIILGIII